MANERFTSRGYDKRKYRVVGLVNPSDIVSKGYENTLNISLSPTEHAGVSKFLNALEKSTEQYPLSTITSITEV